MPFTRFVEIGRVTYIAFGADQGKLAVIVDVIDQSRVLVDGPCSGVPRKAINYKQLHLTSHIVKVAASSRTGAVKKAWEKAEITQKWNASTWAKKIAAREKRAALSDFDRFTLMKAKQSRNRVVASRFGKLKSAARKIAPKPKRANKKVSKK